MNKEIIISKEEAQCLDILLELGLEQVEKFQSKKLVKVNIPNNYFNIVNNFLKRIKVEK